MIAPWKMLPIAHRFILNFSKVEIQGSLSCSHLNSSPTAQTPQCRKASCSSKPCTTFIPVPRPWLKLLPELGMIFPPCLLKSHQPFIAHYKFCLLHETCLHHFSEDWFSLFVTALMLTVKDFSLKVFLFTGIDSKVLKCCLKGEGLFYLWEKGFQTPITLSYWKTGELFCSCQPIILAWVQLSTMHFQVLLSFYIQPMQDLQSSQHFDKHKKLSEWQDEGVILPIVFRTNCILSDL